MADYNPKFNNYYYRAWRWMKNVCFNERTPDFKNYGALGVDCYWSGKHDFDDFHRWVIRRLGPRPDGTVLGRKDKLGNYEPGNLHWETPTRRSRNNPRQNIMATYRRKTQPLADWADELEIPYYTLRRRYQQGWTIKEIAQHYG